MSKSDKDCQALIACHRPGRLMNVTFTPNHKYSRVLSPEYHTQAITKSAQEEGGIMFEDYSGDSVSRDEPRSSAAPSNAQSPPPREKRW